MQGPEHQDDVPSTRAALSEGDGALGASDPVPASDSSALASPMHIDVADGRWKKLERNWITLERISGTIALLLIGGLALVGLVIVVFVTKLPLSIKLMLTGGWFLLAAWLLWLAVWYPPLAWRHARYMVTEQGVEIRRGVWWRKVINVPRSRVQHTDVTQGPLQRRYDIGTLLIHTAGTQNFTVALPGLKHSTAMRIRDYLILDDETAYETTRDEVPDQEPVAESQRNDEVDEESSSRE